MIRRAIACTFVIGCFGAVACSSKSDDTTDCGPDGSGCQTQAASSCEDKKRDGDEIGVDCGGSCPKKCDGAKGCTSNDSCASANCQPDGTCGPSAGKTCGIGLPNPCGDGESCGQDGDCSSDYCGADTKCAEPPPDAHMDGRRNAGETGVDCGGSVAATQPCATGQPCKTSADCVGACDGMMMLCQDPSPTDGKKDGDETDVDCGGATAPKCALTKACNDNSDCQLDACTTNACVTPTSNDGVKNGGETDIDCGGDGVTDGTNSYKAPACLLDKKCAKGTDCASTACSMGTGTCAVPSCATAETAGILTCGAGETGAAGATHETCCKSLTLPTRTTRRLDKYEITSGRFRTFLTRVGPNVRAWAATFATNNPASQLAQMVSGYPVLKNLYPAQDTMAPLAVSFHMGIDIDNYNGVRGCYNGVGDYSANTYWQDNAHEADVSLPPRALARTISDEKSLNCAMPIMFVAFCAWDGGELATYDDYLDVWPAAQKYPFDTNAVDLMRPTYNWCNGTYDNGGFTCQCAAPNAVPSAACPAPASQFAVNGEQGVFYEYPVGTDRSLDNEPLIAAPGRFVGDITVATGDGDKWHDVFANLAEYTGDFSSDPNPVLSTFCDYSDGSGGANGCPGRSDGQGHAKTLGTLYTGIPQVGMVGSTWEGHQYFNTSKASSTINATFQYGKFGARCVRPANPY
ncbi:MAG TPA: hypothetical protein VIF62_11000 [Labilithrix sp.]